MISNIVAGLIVFLLIILAVRSYIRQRGKGRCTGCGGCRGGCEKNK